MIALLSGNQFVMADLYTFILQGGRRRASVLIRIDWLLTRRPLPHTRLAEFNVIAGGKRSCIGMLVAFFDRRKAGLNLVNGHAKGAYAIRETAKIALHAD